MTIKSLALLVALSSVGSVTSESDSPTPVVAATVAAADEEQLPVPVPEPSARAMEYYRTGNRLWLFDEAWDLAVPAIFLFTGASAGLRNLARKLGRFWFLTIGIYAVLYTLVVFVIDFPLHYYRGYVRQHAYGLSNQSFDKWFGDSLKGVAIAAFTGFLTAWVPYLLLGRSPRRWWLYTTLAIVPFLMFAMLVMPIWIDPLFNRYVSMNDKGLEQKLLALASRAGIEGGRIYVVNKSVDTKAMNAKVTGFLGTHRIVLWDTLLAKLDEKEVLAVMGHEMGHYALGHVPRSLLLSSTIVLASLFWVDRAGRWLIGRFSHRFGFDSLADVASVPLILVLVQVASLALLPAANMYSRFQEREADRFSLELTHNNRSSALAFVKLAHENLGNPRPGLLYKIWRSTHPSISERIEFCNAYHPWRNGTPLRYGDRFRP